VTDLDNSLDSFLPRIAESSKRAHVANLLEDMILQGAIAPGEQLPTEMELAQKLEVSRTVIRDAVRILATKGLVDVRQGKGTLVTHPSTEAYTGAILLLLARSEHTVADVYETRRVLDRQLAPVIAENSRAEDAAILSEAATQLEAAVLRADLHSAMQSHVDFHLGLMRAIHLPLLELILPPLEQMLIFTTLPPSLDDPRLWYVEAHRAIADALAAPTGRKRRLEEAIDQHWSFVDEPDYVKYGERSLASAISSRDLETMMRDRSRTVARSGSRAT
jgi:GntR family transcriptional regulator, transcriptional repressor for pyruvate dehydrogenase complex